MGLLLDKDRSLKLFAAADRDRDNNLSMMEFQYVVVLLKFEIAMETQRKLGMTTENLILFGVFGIVLLLLMFTFIFLGIAAFSKADGFNSVINSMMPMAAGMVSSARKIDIKGTIEKVKDKKFIKLIVLIIVDLIIKNNYIK